MKTNLLISLVIILLIMVILIVMASMVDAEVEDYIGDVMMYSSCMNLVYIDIFKCVRPWRSSHPEWREANILASGLINKGKYEAAYILSGLVGLGFSGLTYWWQYKMRIASDYGPQDRKDVLFFIKFMRRFVYGVWWMAEVVAINSWDYDEEVKIEYRILF